MDRYVKQIVDDVMEMAAKIQFLEAKVAAAESWNAEQLADAQATVGALREQLRLANIDQANAEARANDAQQQVEALQRERDKLREATKVICGHCCEPMAIPSKAILQSQLSALQGLVRALPVVRIDLNGAYHDTLLARPEDEAVKELLRYRASLDATTPAPDTSIIGKCEPPSQWDPNAQVRGDIS